MDAATDELRHAHDVLAPVYAERLATILDEMPVERAVLDLFCTLVRESGLGTLIGDIGCGTGRLAPYLAERGFSVTGVDLSPVMVETARRDHLAHSYAVGDLRELPLGDASVAGAIGWYSYMYLAPSDRPRAFAELARVVAPGGHLALAWKLGDDTPRRSSDVLGLGVRFDIYWMSQSEVEDRLAAAGFSTVFWAGRPADPDELQPQGYLIARRD
ncbi:class I SAM-dependent methyltransferase [Calidifontibacter sp. DB0510]|uniref:Class I SAM-dependent methyltransferase n=2 Tax=Metallococcus carri TaxID=1656884 RepID=A0A967B9P6_9MICO|nr:class I SAM-dependent methyltransferase [Metallococcus carri]NOP39173.1 methyltransferase domain-containing protein [Calidifontibacter sp. DB2511S]